MAGTNGTSDMHVLVRFFATYRLFFYLGGLIVMSLPLGLAWGLDIVLADEVRTVIVAVSFTVIVATYLSERQIEQSKEISRVDQVGATITLRQQIALFLSLGGFAASIYMFLTNEFGLGLVFLAGAGLFFQRAVQWGENTEEGVE